MKRNYLVNEIIKGARAHIRNIGVRTLKSCWAPDVIHSGPLVLPLVMEDLIFLNSGWAEFHLNQLIKKVVLSFLKMVHTEGAI